jgi:two-component system cell cycle sensor histidine kinase/response regulator CckA
VSQIDVNSQGKLLHCVNKTLNCDYIVWWRDTDRPAGHEGISMQGIDNDLIWAIIVGTSTLLILSVALVAVVVLSQRKWIKAQRSQMEELRTREQKYRNLFENSLVGMVRLSLHDWTLLETNDAFDKMFKGVLSNVHYDFLSLLSPADQARLKAEIYNTGYVENFETSLKLPDGDSLWISFSGRVFFNDGYVEGIVNDITARKSVEEQLHEKAALLEKAHDAIIVLNLDNIILFWNPGAERVYQWSAKEAVGRAVTHLIYDEQEVPAFRKRRDELLLHGEWNGELNHVRRDGSQVVSASRWTLVRGADGGPKSILEIHTDITEKKVLESKFLRVQRLESLGILAGGIAHDLNNVLAPIILSVQMLKNKLTDVISRKHVATIETSAHRGANLVRQVLTFARGIEGDRIEIKPESLLQEVLKIASQTFPPSIELESAVADGLWTVVGDTTQLHQVLMNLCINAKDAMSLGGRLSVSIENTVVDDGFVKRNPEAKPGVYVVIQVTDKGTGIPPTELDKIFEPFYTTKTFGKGTGLGLSTALGIVKSHGGFMTVESRLGSGTTFKVYLPAQSSQPANKEQDREIEYKEGNGETILLVDDEEPVRETVRAILMEHGYNVVTANDGNEAISAYRENKTRINVVLTDIMMPHLDGSVMIETLINIDPTATIIAMTGMPLTGELKENNKKWIRAILQKPYTADALLRVLDQTLHSRSVAL